MEYIPYKQFLNILFTQSFEEVKKNISIYSDVDVSQIFELDKVFPCIYIQDEDIQIVFTQKGDKVRYIETTKDVIVEGCNIAKESIHKIENLFKKLDDMLIVDEEGNIESRKYGFIISKESNQRRNNVLLYSELYLDEEVITPDDIIKFYLGN